MNMFPIVSMVSSNFLGKSDRLCRGSRATLALAVRAGAGPRQAGGWLGPGDLAPGGPVMTRSWRLGLIT